jgi:hypothetical protein
MVCTYALLKTPAVSPAQGFIQSGASYTHNLPSDQVHTQHGHVEMATRDSIT